MQLQLNAYPLPAFRGIIATLTALLLAWMLGACETLPPTTVVPLSAPAVAENYSLTGRLSVRVGERLDSVKLIWSKDSHALRMQFFSPFGLQLAEVTQVDGGEATLLQGREVTTAASLGVLTQLLLGVALDGNEIGKWVQGVGLSEGDAHEVTLADGGNWTVTVERMQSVVTPDRPGQVFRRAARLTAVNGGTVIRLVIDDWQPA